METTGFDIAARGMTVRENTEEPRGKSIVNCPRCAAPNPAAMSHCRSCYSPLGSRRITSMVAKPLPRTLSPSMDPRRPDFDAIFGELEALTRDEDAAPVLFQCPRCGRSVEADAVQCACGAMFSDTPEILGYECPKCGSRVPESASRCTCGVQFLE